MEVLVTRDISGVWWNEFNNRCYVGEDAAILDKLFGYKEEPRTHLSPKSGEVLRNNHPELTGEASRRAGQGSIIEEPTESRRIYKMWKQTGAGKDDIISNKT